MERGSMISELAEAYKDIHKGTYNFTKDGRCIGCGECCSSLLPLSDKDIKRIKVYMIRHNIKERKRITPSARPVIDLTCPFRDNVEKKCTVYPVRPDICRQFRCDRPSRDIACRMDVKAEYRVYDVREVFF